MYFNNSFVLKKVDPNRDKINPDKLAKGINIVKEEGNFIDGLFDFFARYVRKVHSDEFIRKAMKINKGTSFIDIIGPNDIAYVIAVFKNNKEMWDQDIRMRESEKDAVGNSEKKMKPIFTSGAGQKRVQGKSLWNKEGMTFFRSAAKKWKEIYDSEEDMKILYNGWDEWITSKGKDINVGDGTRRTYHYVMGSWYDEEETTELIETNDESEDEDGFGIGGGYSSDRGISRHSSAWRKGQLREKKMPGGKKRDSSDSSDDEDKINRKSPPLFSVPAGSSGSPAGNTRASARRGVANEKEQQKRKK